MEETKDALCRMCRQVLDRTHPGWAEVVGLPDVDYGATPDTEYRRWLAMQPDEYQHEINNAWSPVVIGDSLDAFYAWQREVCDLNAAFEKR